MRREHETCGWCDELLLPEQKHAIVRTYHHECAVRSIIGGLNHQRGTCVCCGGTDPPDPPGASRREAALMALLEWESRTGRI